MKYFSSSDVVNKLLSALSETKDVTRLGGEVTIMDVALSQLDNKLL